MNVRVLDEHEHHKILGLGPFADVTTPPHPDHTAIVVVEDDQGDIKGFWCAFDAVHLEPLWIAPECRNHGKIGRELWDGLRIWLRARGVANAFAMIGDADVGTHLPMARRLGFERMGVQTMYIDLAGLDAKLAEEIA